MSKNHRNNNSNQIGGYRAKKSLGQNFLVDESVITDIADAAGIDSGTLAIEIGPGMGALTSELVSRAGRVVAIELDKELIPILRAKFFDSSNLEIINEDVLKVDMASLIASRASEGAFRASKVCILGNLPYYITTPIIMGLLEARLPAESITVMVQKEVAERMASGPGGKDYGVLSLSVAYYSECGYVRDVGPECFRPQPKVDSAVVKLKLLKEPPVQVRSAEMLFRTIKAGFGQRRKTLSNSLEGGGLPRDSISTALRAAEIDPKRRAETLSLAEFARLSDALMDAGAR
ncbi:MAG: 16S rRNA (adenine(1518)-N(6)/adenine(1519)-N(6))-dimethyltransferase RsmA [Firmicutes bacterium]|nr:16S rRNA (adenine(1518)-N(6)/adenine(1519)-N(6))-dimethyltransferase RsmA [Bacillota bacterium]